MEETQKLFDTPPTTAERDETVVNEPDRTLATPRFDEVEAQVARPVVPLAGRPARTARRQWPIALVLISALAGGVVSLLAFRLYQQRQTQAVATQVEGQTPAADAAGSPALPPATATTEEQAQSNAPVVFEEFDPAKEGGAISDAAPSQPSVTAEAVAPATPRREEAKAEAKDEPKPAPRAAEPKPRLVETIGSPRQVEARQEEVVRQDRRADDEEFGDRRRERRRQRREQRREQRRNIDRIKDIFEGAPPS
jgi:type IV secretory pathway VirB10-like protein